MKNCELLVPNGLKRTVDKFCAELLLLFDWKFDSVGILLLLENSHPYEWIRFTHFLKIS